MSFLSRATAQMKSFLPSRRNAIILSLFLLVGIFITTTGAHANGSTVDSNLSPFSTQQWLSYIPATLGYIFAGLAWGIGKLIILVLGWVIIPILSYNEFANSNMVSIGWALVRDIVNMFVIVILLLIALQTMFGVGRVDWRQQLPKLFLAVIAINFSKTITLFMVDIGQVVMFTFVNALKDIAAGNFTNLFQINSFMSLSQNEQGVTGIAASGGYNAIGFMASAYLTLALLSMVLIVLLMLALVFIYRIVVIWILIIMSPIAFFAGGVGNTLSSFGNQYGEWWKKLVGAVALGPIMTFFLWLALASASQGAIATSEGFQTSTSSEAGAASTIYNEWADPEAFLSILLAMVIITVGFQAASSQASALGGPAASFFTEGMGQRLLKGAVSAPAALGYAGARAGYRGAAYAAGGAAGAARTGGGYAGAGLRTAAGAGLKAAGGFAEGRLGGTVGSFIRPSELTARAARGVSSLREMSLGGIPVGRAAVGLTGIGAAVTGAAGAAAAARKAHIDEGKEKFGSYSDEQKFQTYDDIASGAIAAPGGAFAQSAGAAGFIQNKAEQKAYKERLVAQGLSENDANARVEATKANSFKEFQKNKEAFVGDDKAKQEAAFKVESANLHRFEGKGGTPDEQAARKAKIKAHVEDENFKNSQLTEDAAKDVDVQQALKEKAGETIKDLKTGERFSAWEELSQGGKGVTSGVRNIAASDIRASAPAAPGAADAASANAEAIAKALQNAEINVSSVTAQNVQGANGDNVVEGMARAANSGVDLRTLDPSTKAAADASMQQKMTNASPADEAKYRRTQFSMDQTPEKLGVDSSTGNMQPGAGAGARIAVEQEFHNNPQNISTFTQTINAAPAGGNDVTAAVAAGVTQDDITKLFDKFTKETDASIRANLADSVSSIETAFKKESTRAGVTKEEKASMMKVQRQAKRVKDRMK